MGGGKSIAAGTRPMIDRWVEHGRMMVGRIRRAVRSPNSRLLRITAVLVVVSVLTAGWGLGWFSTRPANSHSNSTSPGGPPTVSASVDFGDNSSRPTTSPSFISTRGDAVVTWIALFGHTSVLSVADSNGDPFHELVDSGMAYGTSGAYNGLSVWAASDVAGGPAVTVTTTLSTNCSPCAIHSAIVVVDITGTGAASIDRIGPVVNSSALPNQESRGFSCSVNAGGADLVLGGVSARNIDNFTAATESIVNEARTLGTGVSDSMTVAVFATPAGATARTVWVNGTDDQSSAWVAEALAIGSSSPSPSP
jgi:hypothetical protein